MICPRCAGLVILVDEPSETRVIHQTVCLNCGRRTEPGLVPNFTKKFHPSHAPKEHA